MKLHGNSKRHSLLSSPSRRQCQRAVRASKQSACGLDEEKNDLVLESTSQTSDCYHAWSRDEYMDISAVTRLVANPFSRPLSIDAQTFLSPFASSASLVVLSAGVVMSARRLYRRLMNPRPMMEDPILLATQLALKNEKEASDHLQKQLEIMRNKVSKLSDELKETLDEGTVLKNQANAFEWDASTFRDGFKRLQSERNELNEKITDLEASNWKRKKEFEKV